LRSNEIHALVGENGAGKSTFIKILAGVYHPDRGEILLDGHPVTIRDPIAAAKLGIAAIHQHAASYPDLSVAENIFIGHEFMRAGFINWRKTYAEAKRLLDGLGADIDPATAVSALSVAQRQLVEIAKALSVNAKILIMDEPTAALSRRESEELYGVSRKLRDRGTSIILISHRFEDIFGLADRATVLRDGKYIGTWDINAIDDSQLVGHMVGRDITHFFPKKHVPIGEELLTVDNISRAGFFRDVSLSVRAGEIVGLTGLVGAGRTEVAEAIAGVTRPDAGRILIKGELIRVDSPHKARAAGMGLLPEDRQSDGLLLPWSINYNVTLPVLDRLRRAIFISNGKERALSTDLKQRLMIKANDVDAAAESLSGGNQQKVVVAKQLAADPMLIILDEPTKGVDVGSKAAIYEIMSELAGRGIGILMVSSEMPEILNMSDRVYVMRGGRISAEFAAKGLKQERVLAAAVPEYGAGEAVAGA